MSAATLSFYLCIIDVYRSEFVMDYWKSGRRNLTFGYQAKRAEENHFRVEVKCPLLHHSQNIHNGFEANLFSEVRSIQRSTPVFLNGLSESGYDSISLSPIQKKNRLLFSRLTSSQPLEQSFQTDNLRLVARSFFSG
jgi:hypothetical protein